MIPPIFRLAPFVLVRTPLLSSSVFEELAPSSPSDDSTAFETRLQDCVARLRACMTRPDVREAILVSSPQFSERLAEWLDGKEDLDWKVAESCCKYLSRMSQRATPYGLFAGTFVAREGDHTAITLKSRDHYRRHSRIDMGVLYRASDTLARRSTIRELVGFRRNSSLYQSGDQYRYVERRLDLNDSSVEYALSSVEVSEELTDILEAASNEVTLGQLVLALVQKGFNKEEAHGFIVELVDNQLLQPLLEPPLTGRDGLRAFIETCTRWIPANPICEQLKDIDSKLRELDTCPPGTGVELVSRLEYLIDQLPAPSGVLPRDRLDIQMRVTAHEPIIGRNVFSTISGALSVLAVLAAARARGPGSRHAELGRFIETFTDRYGAGEWIPLAEALDDEDGIGFSGAWASANPGSERSPSPSPAETEWLDRLGALLENSLRSGSPIDLDENDLPRALPEAGHTVANAMMCLVSIAANSASAIDSGDYRIALLSCAGASSVAMLGRFCNGDDELTELVKHQSGVEQTATAEAVIAEIVHLPNGRMGNVIARPVFRDFEIPYLGKAGVPRTSQIDISDLLVSVSEHNVWLWSQRLGTRIIPSLSSAHAAYQQRQLPIYRFLYLMQSQGMRDLAWHWGPFANLPYLPRVQCGRAILSLAQWRLDSQTLRSMPKTRGEAEHAWVQECRRTHQLPRWIVLHAGDNELVVDLDNPISVLSLVKEIRGLSQVTLIEMFPTPSQRWIEGPDGPYAHEVMVSLTSPEDRTPRLTLDRPPTVITRERGFAPGSDWLYAKLYTGVANSDRLLLDVIGPVIAQFGAEEWFRSWFFIRYADPNHHLRFRVHGNPEQLLGLVIPAIQERVAGFLSSGAVSKLQLDTYSPEYARYGGPLGVRLAERVFHADSQSVLALLPTLPNKSDSRLRRLVTIMGMDRLLLDFGLTVSERAKLLQSILSTTARGQFGSDANATAAVRSQSASYRAERQLIEGIVEQRMLEGLDAARSVFAARSRSMLKIAEDMKAAETTGGLRRPLLQVLPSFLHMHANRVIRDDHLRLEFTIYDALSRAYKSIFARHTQHESAIAGSPQTKHESNKG